MLESKTRGTPEHKRRQEGAELIYAALNQRRDGRQTAMNICVRTRLPDMADVKLAFRLGIDLRYSVTHGFLRQHVAHTQLQNA